jgi:sterol desaturase/sphingolipid hydroxylase (fatty acid hydroxylase superfamily)
MSIAADWWFRWEAPLVVLTIVATHLTISCSQTLLHYWLGHRRLGGLFFRNHINFHHTYYARGHLASADYHGDDGNNTPFFLIPTMLVGTVVFFLLPLGLFLAMAVTAAVSFGAHVYFDKAYHIEGSMLERFAWFRSMQQLHFVHHLHANSNFAVIDFYWDRLLGTYRRPDRTTQAVSHAGAEGRPGSTETVNSRTVDVPSL